jgi:hypothetical protein
MANELRSENNRLTPEQIVPKLINALPGFRESEEYKYADTSLAYIVAGAFGRFFVKYINELQYPQENNDVIATFNLVNDFYDAKKSDALSIDMLNLQFFEPLSLDKKGTEMARLFIKNLPQNGFTWE